MRVTFSGMQFSLTPSRRDVYKRSVPFLKAKASEAPIVREQLVVKRPGHSLADTCQVQIDQTPDNGVALTIYRRFGQIVLHEQKGKTIGIRNILRIELDPNGQMKWKQKTVPTPPTFPFPDLKEEPYQTTPADPYRYLVNGIVHNIRQDSSSWKKPVIKP